MGFLFYRALLTQNLAILVKISVTSSEKDGKLNTTATITTTSTERAGCWTNKRVEQLKAELQDSRWNCWQKRVAHYLQLAKPFTVFLCSRPFAGLTCKRL